MLFTRFGDRVELVRVATVQDVRAFENRKPDAEDKRRTREGWRAIARYCGGPNRGKEILVDAAFLRADNGWSEISDAFHALPEAHP